MDFNQIRYFLHAADTLNFTEAAMRSGVSRPMLARARPAARTRAWRNVGLSRWKRQSTNRTRRRHRDQPNLMAKLGQLTSPVMCSTTCFECYHATRLRCEELQQPSSADPLAEHRSTTLIRSMNVKNVLGDIQTDCDNL